MEESTIDLQSVAQSAVSVNVKKNHVLTQQWMFCISSVHSQWFYCRVDRVSAVQEVREIYCNIVLV